MEILKMTRTNMVVIQTVEKEERNTFDIGKSESQPCHRSQRKILSQNLKVKASAME